MSIVSSLYTLEADITLDCRKERHHPLLLFDHVRLGYEPGVIHQSSRNVFSFSGVGSNCRIPYAVLHDIAVIGDGLWFKLIFRPNG